MGVRAVDRHPAGLERDRLSHPSRRERGDHAGRRRRRRHLLRRDVADQAVGVHRQTDAEPLSAPDRHDERHGVRPGARDRHQAELPRPASTALSAAGGSLARNAGARWARIAAAGIGGLPAPWKNHCACTPAGVLGNAGPGGADDRWLLPHPASSRPVTATATRADRRHRAVPGRSRSVVVAGAGSKIAVPSARRPAQASFGSLITRLRLSDEAPAQPALIAATPSKFSAGTASARRRPRPIGAVRSPTRPRRLLKSSQAGDASGGRRPEVFKTAPAIPPGRARLLRPRPAPVLHLRGQPAGGLSLLAAWPEPWCAGHHRAGRQWAAS